MKTVVSTSMVAHLWANQSQDHARNSGNTLYFNGDTIYSYGSHFPIARHVRTDAGNTILFTTKDYSPTTSRHKYEVLHAIAKDAVVIHCAYVAEYRSSLADGSHLDNLREMADRYKDYTGKAERARREDKKAWYLEQAITLIEFN